MPHPGAPAPGVSYPLRLGETLTESSPSSSYCSLRYDFKPASAGRFRPGSLQLQPAESRVMVQLPDSTNEGADVAFTGRYEGTRDDMDSVAIFDGTSWRLELVQGLVKTLKATGRSTQPSRAATPQREPPAAPLEEGDDEADELEAALEDDLMAEEHSPSPEEEPAALTAEAARHTRPVAALGRDDDGRRAVPAHQAQEQQQQQKEPAARRSASPPPQVADEVPDDAPDWERDFYRAPESDASDDEDLNRCSDDDSDIGIEDF